MAALYACAISCAGVAMTFSVKRQPRPSGRVDSDGGRIAVGTGRPRRSDFASDIFCAAPATHLSVEGFAAPKDGVDLDGELSCRRAASDRVGFPVGALALVELPHRRVVDARRGAGE